MLFNHVHVLAASLVLFIPYVQDCDCEFDPQIPGQVNDDGDDNDDGDYCEPYEEDSECRSCLRTTCCEGLDACEGNRTCRCVVDCMETPGVDLAACARERCDTDDLALALAPMTRWCAIDESCVGPRYCEAPDEKPLPQFR